MSKNATQTTKNIGMQPKRKMSFDDTRPQISIGGNQGDGINADDVNPAEDGVPGQDGKNLHSAHKEKKGWKPGWKVYLAAAFVGAVLAPVTFGVINPVTAMMAVGAYHAGAKLHDRYSASVRAQHDNKVAHEKLHKEMLKSDTEKVRAQAKKLKQERKMMQYQFPSGASSPNRPSPTPPNIKRMPNISGQSVC